MKIIKIIVCLILLLVSGTELLAQDNCSEQLRLAQRRYETGVLDEIPRILESCLERGFTREEKVNAYKLLIQTYLFSDMYQEADQVMLQFLRDFPEYNIIPSDHQEFITLYNTYRTDPIMRIEVGLGGTMLMPHIKEYYGPEDVKNTSPSYANSLGGSLEINYLKEFSETIDGSIGPSIAWVNIGYTNTPYPFTTVLANYTSFYLGIPIAVRYNISLLGLNTYIKGGVEPVYLLYSGIDFTRERTGGQDPITGTVNVTQYNKRFDIKPTIGFGMNFNIAQADLMFTAGLKFGTIMPTEASKRFSNDDLLNRYYFTSDDFFIHQAYISLSYIFSIYSPKKIH